jgi:hypothetical protein
MYIAPSYTAASGSGAIDWCDIERGERLISYAVDMGRMLGCPAFADLLRQLPVLESHQLWRVRQSGAARSNAAMVQQIESQSALIEAHWNAFRETSGPSVFAISHTQVGNRLAVLSALE